MQDYTFHLTLRDQPEPEVLSVVVSGDERARELAADLLGRSPDRLALKAWKAGAAVFELTAPEAEA